MKKKLNFEYIVYIMFCFINKVNMGGNAIKDKKTNKSICQRLTKLNYEKVKHHILKILNDNNVINEFVFELPNKQNFGDVDIKYFSDRFS